MSAARVLTRDVQRTVAKRFNTPSSAMLSSSMNGRCPWPTRIAIYLTRKLTKNSLPEIGRRFGGRHHTTILHVVRDVTDKAAKDPLFATELRTIESEINPGEAP